MVLPVVVLLPEAAVAKTGPLLRGAVVAVVVDGVLAVVGMADLLAVVVDSAEFLAVVELGVHLRAEWEGLPDMGNNPCIRQELQADPHITNKAAARRIP